MSTTAVAVPVNMQELLFPDGAAADRIARQLHDHGVARAALRAVPHLSGDALGAVDNEVGSIVDGLLDMDLGDILVSCWRKHRALVEAAERSIAAPGSEEVVVLAQHQATARYRPTVDLLVDGLTVTTLEIELAVTFVVDGLDAVVRAGRLAALTGGRCVVTASLTMEGLLLAQQQRHVDPALVVDLHGGISLVDQGHARRPTG